MQESIFLTKLLTHTNETQQLRAQLCNFYSLKSVPQVTELLSQAQGDWLKIT